MWLQVLVSADDVGALLARCLPLTVDLGEGRHVWVGDVTALAMVPGVGVRVTTALEVRWALAGVGTSLSAPSIGLLLKPEVRRDGERDVLALRAEVEEATILHVPGLFEPAIVSALNLALGERAVIWDFSKTLQRRFDGPESFAEISAISTRVSWGEHRIAEEGMVLALSLSLDIERAPTSPDEP